MSQPTSTGLQPTSTGLQPTSTGSQPTSTGLQTTSTGLQPISTGLQTASTGLQTTSTVSQTSSTVLQTTSTVSQTTSTLSKPTSTLSQPTSTVSQTTSIVLQPTSTVLQPLPTVLQHQTGANVSTIQFEAMDHFIFRLIKMVHKCAQPVMLDVFKAETHNFTSTQSFLKYLETQKGFSKTMLKIVNRTQRDTINNDFIGDTYDVTLLHVAIALLRSYFQTDQSTGKVKLIEPNDTLQHHLIAVKNFRNDLMHLQCTDPTIDFRNEFVNKTESLRNHLGEIIESMKTIYNIDDLVIQRDIQSMNENINFVRDTPLTPLDIKQYQDQLLFDNLSRLLINEGAKELKIIYEKWSYINPLSFMDGFNSFLEVSGVFTRLEMKESGKDSKNTDIDYRNILDFVQNMPSHHCNIQKEVILIEGPAGSGKTTLTKMFLHDWTSRNNTINGLKDFDLLIHMECRNPNNKCLLELIKSLIPQTAKKFRDENLMTCINNFKLLFLIDGLDEINDSSIKVIQEILNLPWSHNATIICTSRPERTSNFYKMIQPNVKIAHLQVLGIAGNQKIEFVTKYHNELIKNNQSKQSTTGLIDFLKVKSRRLNKHLQLPLNLVMITQLWVQAPGRVNSVTSASELYTQISQLNVEKLIERLLCKAAIQIMTTDQLKNKTDIFLPKLYEASLKSLREDNIILTDEVTNMLHKICNDIGLPQDEIIGAFLVKKTIWTQVGMKVYASFPHKSLQEYYAAQHLFSLVQKTQPDIDLTSLLKDIQPIMDKHDCSSPISNNISDTIKRMLESAASANMSMTLSEKIENECLKNTSTKSLSKFQNVFVHLIGLLYSNCATVDKDTVDQMIQLLVKSVEKRADYRDKWLDIWSEAKYDNEMANCITHHIPNLMSDHLNIYNDKVTVYCNLLPYYSAPCYPKPESVSVVISDPDVAPSLPVLKFLDQLMVLDAKINLTFIHQFRNPHTLDKNLDDKLQLLFEKCKVDKFYGHLSGDAVRKLSACVSVTHLGIAITDQTPYFNDALESLTQCPKLNSLEIHIPAGTRLDLLPSLPYLSKQHHETLQYGPALPSLPYAHVIIFFSEVTSQHLDWVLEALKRLTRNKIKLWCIQFPLCDLAKNDICNLLETMEGEGIEVYDCGFLGGIRVSGKIEYSYQHSGFNVAVVPYLLKEYSYQHSFFNVAVVPYLLKEYGS